MPATAVEAWDERWAMPEGRADWQFTTPSKLVACRPFRLTRRWREMDSNLYGAFPVKPSFLVVVGSLFGAGKPFFVPSPTIRFAERAEGVKGPKRLAQLGGLPPSGGLCFAAP